MVKHKKPSSSKKKGNKKQQNLPLKTPSIDDLIEAADAASASTEPEKALAIFASAEILLRGGPNTNSENIDNQRNDTREKHIYVLEKLGELKVSMGDQEGALQDFKNAVDKLTAATKPDASDAAQYHETLGGLYLYMGQLKSDLDALEAYKKGLRSLETCVDLRQAECAQAKQTTQEADAMEIDDAGKESVQAALAETRQKLGSAYATVAELYLTDLCFEDNAEQECEAKLNMALKIVDAQDGEPLVDALQTAASLRLSQRRRTEARQYIIRAYNKMKTGCEALAKLVGLAEHSKRAKELSDVDAANNLPSFEFRCQTAKLLLECAEPDDNDHDEAVNRQKIARSSGATSSLSTPATKEEQEQKLCVDSSIHVLGSLLAENDEVPEIWFLLGCAFQTVSNTELAKDYCTKAEELLSKIKEDMEKELAEADMQDDDDDDDLDESADQFNMQLQSVSCQLEDVKQKLADLNDEESSKTMVE